MLLYALNEESQMAAEYVSKLEDVLKLERGARDDSVEKVMDSVQECGGKVIKC